MAQDNTETTAARLQMKNQSMKASSETVVTKYANLDEKIAKRFIKDQIPATFPEYKKESETVEQYKQRAKQWMQKNIELVKPEYRNKLIESENSDK